MQWKWVLVCWGLLAAEVCVLLCFFLMPLSQVPVSRLANDLETATLHSINISLKSIMSLLNEIKAEHFKSCFSLVSANMSFILDADYFPPHCCLLSLSLSVVLISQIEWERFIKSPKLRLISTVLWIVKMPSPAWRLQSRTPQPPQPTPNQRAHQHCHGNKVARNSFSADWG